MIANLCDSVDLHTTNSFSYLSRFSPQEVGLRGFAPARVALR